MSFQFQNTIYAAHHRMIAAVATEWWTAGGSNAPEVIDAIGCSDDGLAEADDMIDGWDLDGATAYGDGPSWMESNNTTREMLAEAIRDFWVNRPDRKAEEA